MYTPLRSNYLRRSLLINKRRYTSEVEIDPDHHRDRVKQELRALGVSKYALLHTESRYLPHVIHPDERLGGVVYGRQGEDFAMLVATDRRIIFLDKKPLFVNEDEITFNVVSGVTYNQAGIGCTVTLHTRLRDYSLRTLNKKCAANFVDYIEKYCLDRKPTEEVSYDQLT